MQKIKKIINLTLKSSAKSGAFLFVVLFVVFTMGVIWIFSILANNNVLQKGTPRIITLVCLIAVSVIYWTVFYILLRRQDQRKDN